MYQDFRTIRFFNLTAGNPSTRAVCPEPYTKQKSQELHENSSRAKNKLQQLSI